MPKGCTPSFPQDNNNVITDFLTVYINILSYPKENGKYNNSFNPSLYLILNRKSENICKPISQDLPL